MPYVSKEQLTAAREVDLLTYLRCFEPQELVHISGSTYATRTHDSLKISNGKWFWWSRGIGGRNALDYLTAVEGLWLPEAVQRILGESPCIPPPPKPAVLYPKTEFTLPPKHADNRRVFAYLRSRGIDAEIISHCIKHGLLYESAQHHNCVFVGKNSAGQAKYAGLRGTYDRDGKGFRGDVAGSDKRVGFALPYDRSSDQVFVFEAPIDLMSYLTLHRNTPNALALCGLYDGALQAYLADHPQIKRIELCLDADGPGREAARQFQNKYTAMGYAVTVEEPRSGKDWNEYLQKRKTPERGR